MLGAGFEVVVFALVMVSFDFRRLKHTVQEFQETCLRDDSASSDGDDDSDATNYKYVSLSGLIRRAKHREKKWGRLRRLPSVLNPNPHRSIFYSTSRRRLGRGGSGGGSGHLVRTISGRTSIWRNRAGMLD